MAKILAIDDDQSIIELLTVLLTQEGHVVVVAMDGLSGPIVAKNEKPDLIILDYNMPAANGAKVHERLRDNTLTANMPIIFLTATPIGEIVTMVKDDSLTRYLQKPVNIELLCETINILLPGQAPPPEASAEQPEEEAPPAPAPPPPKRSNPDESPSGDEILNLD